jgi:hypothetical protein
MKEDKQWQAIQLDITAKNSGGRTAYVLDSIWVAEGIRLQKRSLKDEDGAEHVKKAISEGIPNSARYFSFDDATQVQGGSAFQDTLLPPNEAVTRSVVIYVPQDWYDLLWVYVRLPTVAVAHSAKMTWEPAGAGVFNPVLTLSNGTTTSLLFTDKQTPDIQRQISDIGFQMAENSQQLSLWESETPTPAATKESEISSH